MGALCVGLFAVNEPDILPNGGLTRGQSGLFKGGGFHLLGVQFLAVFSVSLWSGITTWILLAAIDKITPIRMCLEEEILGADIWIHDIRHDSYDYDSIIGEMRQEGLDLVAHIRQDTLTSHDFHLDIIEKFLGDKNKQQNSQWWRKLTNGHLIERNNNNNNNNNDNNYDDNRGNKNTNWSQNGLESRRIAWVDAALGGTQVIHVKPALKSNDKI